jgi:hypothetical protein
VIIVHALCTLLGVLVSLVAVIGVHTLSLSQLVDFTSDEAGKEFFGKGMGDRLACRLCELLHMCIDPVE